MLALHPDRAKFAIAPSSAAASPEPGSTRIGVIRPGALGDAILTLPVLASLRAGDPGRRITVVGPSVFGLAVDCGLADERVAFDDPRLLGLFAEGGTSEVLAGCTTCLVYGKEPNAALAATLKRSGVARVVEWPAWPRPGRHIVDHLLGAAEAAGYPVATRIPRLDLDPEQGAGASESRIADCGLRIGNRKSEIENRKSAGHPAAWLSAADSFLRERGVPARFAAIHTGSGGRWKRWPVGRFIELGQRLRLPVVWLLGPAEAEDAGFQALDGLGAAMAVDLPLRTLAGLLARCSVFVGNDSGVSHLAAAVGAPTVAIFGPTDPAVWGPRGARVWIAGGPAMGGLGAVTVEEVVRAVDEAQREP